jgi:hypothetical protein
LLADVCELCRSQDRVQVHHIRQLQDLQRPGQAERPHWINQMLPAGAKPWSCANSATRSSSMQDGQMIRTGTSHWRAVCIERCTHGSEGADGKVPASEGKPSDRQLASGRRYQELGWQVKYGQRGINGPRTIGVELQDQGLLALIGRDLPSDCILHYNGPTGGFTLSI